MNRVGDATGEFPGLVARDDADLERWLAAGEHEDALDPELPIIDPHHHLWDRPDARYLLPELLTDIGGSYGVLPHNIIATVYIEARSMYRQDGPPEMAPIGEVEFANGIAAMSASGNYGPGRVAAAIVGRADLDLGARVRDVLEAELAASGGRLRGIRHSLWWDRDDVVRRAITRPVPRQLAMDPGFRAGYAQLTDLGLSFEAWLFHPQLPELIDLARAFPDTTVVLDHVGGVLGIGPFAGHRQDVLAQWGKDIRELATCPNVNVKLGGMGMTISGFDFHEQDVPPTSAQLAAAWRQYIEPCIEAFGVDRCMFESNFPPDKQSCGYTELWNAFKLLAADASATEKTALFSGTAARVYRLTAG